MNRIFYQKWKFFFTIIESFWTAGSSQFSNQGFKIMASEWSNLSRNFTGLLILLVLLIRWNSWVCSFLKASNMDWCPWKPFECLGLRLSKLNEVKSAGCRDLGTLWGIGLGLGFWVVSTTFCVVVSGATDENPPRWHFLMGLELGWGLSRALSWTLSMKVLSQIMSERVLCSMESINFFR